MTREAAPSVQRIPVCEPYLAGRELEYVAEAVRTNWISSAGEYLEAFEERFAAYCGCRHGIATTSGTTALHLAVAAAGLGPGDEIVMPTFTIAACAFAAAYVGSIPVLVDAEPDTWTMAVDELESRVTSRTRAIMPVHIYGHPCEMEPVLAVAKRHGLLVIEDAAEVHGAEYRGRRCGGLGDLGCFSFYANKIISTGEGGMVVTSDGALADRCRSLRNLAFRPDRRYVHHDIGFNYRLTNVQAAIGLAQLERIDSYVARRRHNAARYNELLAPIEGLTLPVEQPWARNVYWMYGVLVDDSFGCGRDELARALTEQGIETRTFFVPMHEQPVFLERGWFRGEEYPVASDLSRRGLYLPSSTGLQDDQIQRVAAAIREAQRATRL